MAPNRKGRQGVRYSLELDSFLAFCFIALDKFSFSSFICLVYHLIYLIIIVLLLSLQVEKETGFGNFRFNHNLLGDHVPSMFENGDRHKQLKSFLIAVSQNMLKMGRLIPNIMDIMPEHLIKWNFKEGKWVDHVRSCLMF